MKAFVIRGKEDCFFIDTEKPGIQGPKDVLVQVKAVGICGTDLHIYEGDHAMCIGVDRIPGHEFSGEVVEVGAEVTNFQVGDRVVHEPISYCGTCYACRKGQGNVCRHLEVTGCNMNGGFQEFYCAPERQWHKIPEGVTWAQAALAEPYTIAHQVCSQAKLEEGDTVLIQGAGPVGLMCCDVASKMGATVVISELSETRLELARAAGAHHTVNPKETDLPAFIEKLTDGEGINVILDCAGIAALMKSNMDMLSPAGRFVNVAPCKAEVDGLTMMVKQLTYVGSRLQMNKFVPVLEQFHHYLPTINEMITHTFPFSKTDEAFAHADARGPGTGKVVVTFEDA